MSGTSHNAGFNYIFKSYRSTYCILDKNTLFLQKNRIMSRYINPFTDFGFKNLFGREYSKDILIDFLNDLYQDLPGMSTIVDLRYCDKESTRCYFDGKTVIYDIRCLTDDNRHLIIEMQVNSQKTFLSRALYYLCRAVSDQGELGDEWKYDFQPVYGVYFMDFKMAGLEPKVKIHSRICDIESGKPLTDKMCLSFIQLEYFDKTIDECHNGFDRWIYILKNMSTMNLMPFTAEKEIFKKVQTVSDYQRLDKKARAEYDDALKRYRDYNCVLSTAREEGYAQGAEDKNRSTARNFYKLGVDIEIIIQATGLSADEIKAL